MLSVDRSGHYSPPSATVGLSSTFPEGPSGLLLARSGWGSPNSYRYIYASIQEGRPMCSLQPAAERRTVHNRFLLC